MSYEKWRLSFQSSEQAARAAYRTNETMYEQLQQFRDKANNLDSSLKQSTADIQALATCLNECLDQVNEAITVTMRSGNRGGLRVDGQLLTPAQVSERLEALTQQRERMLKALHPLRSCNNQPEKTR